MIHRHHHLHETIDYTYDLAGRCTQLTNSTGALNYTYDVLNRLTSLTDQASRSYGFVYDLAGRLTKQTYPNGTYSLLDYDVANQLTDKVHYHANGTTLGDNTYLYNAAGNITGWGSSDGNTRAFTYDPNDRLLGSASSAPSAVPSETFSYDQVGNWTPYGGRLHNAANEITEDSGYIYSYDLDGNLVEKASKLDLSDVTTYAWDPLNRLIQVNKGAHVISYRYDGLGRRIAKVVDGVETRYVLDGQNVVEQRSGMNALTAVNLHAGLDRLLMRQDYAAGATYWTHADHLGSVEALTDATGSVVERYRYSTFGQLTVLAPDFSLLASAPKVPFTYASREWEPEVGMYFYRARFMDPRLGRFISRDPLGFVAGDFNILTYVGNNPINETDPLGLWTFQIGISLNGQFGPLNVNWNVGIAVDGHGNIGTYDTGGLGVGAGAGVSGGVSLNGSNGDTIQDLAGPFANVSGGLGAGINGSVEGFSGKGENGQTVAGGGVTIGVGAGGGASEGGAQTYIHPLWSPKDVQKNDKSSK